MFSVTSAWRLAEPGWHRRLRSARSKVRSAFRTVVWKRWSLAKIKRAARFLQLHHGSQVPLRVQHQILGLQAYPMTSTNWTCRFCSIQMTLLVAHCSGCNRHWKQAQQGAARRSQSRRVRKTKENQQTTERNSKALNSNAEKEDKVNTPVEEIFSARLPWVVNSPHARAPVETKTSLVEEPTSALPVPPEAKSSSEATSGSSEEDLAKVHQHLKALKTALGSLPEELERKLAACEDKAREKALSHGHLNRLGKVNKQMKAIASKIQAMDQGWKQFAQTVATKFNEHRQLYHKSREGLMQDYLSKAQELQAAKEEVQLASQHLFAAQMEAPAESLPDATAAMMEAALQEDTFLEPTKFDGYALEENTIEVDEDELMQVAEGMKPPARAPIQPFSRKVTSSPTKVANLHLKTKEAEKPKTK